MIIIDIGRKSIYGNPFKAKPAEKLLGTTLDKYERWLYQALQGDKNAYKLYFHVTSIELPSHEEYCENIRNLYRRVRDDEIQLRCPGCREHTAQENICHGSILLLAGKWLYEGTGGPD